MTDIPKIIKVGQLAQMGIALFDAIAQAVAAGKDGVSPDELADAFHRKDAELVRLTASIARAKAEGR